MKKRTTLLALFLILSLALPRRMLAQTSDIIGCPASVVSDWNNVLRLAESGNATAQFQIGDVYFHGNGKKQDYSEARNWFLLSAAQENALAAVHLGFIYGTALEVATDSVAAEKWLQKAAATGNPDFQYHLGMFFEGTGRALEANACFQKAVKNGHVPAMFSLGQAYLHGKGVLPDPVAGIKLIQQSAEGGFLEACYCLGTCYDKGEGFKQDLKEAFRWYEISARKGDLRAWGAMGSMYEKGEGVAKDLAQADAWYSLLASPEVASNSRGQYLSGEAMRRKFFLENELTPLEKERAEETLKALKQNVKPSFSESPLGRGQ